MAISYSDPDVDSDEHTIQLAALTPTDNGVIIGNGTAWTVESGSTFRASVGLAIGTDVQAYDADLAQWAGVNPSSYLTTSAAALAYQPLDADLTAWAGVNPSSYSTTSQIAAAYQPLDADLTSWAGVTRAAGFDAFAATPTSANLRTLLTDEVGTGGLYFVGGALGTPASGLLTNCTGLPNASVVGLGTAAVVNTGTSGATIPLLNGANTWGATQTIAPASGAAVSIVQAVSGATAWFSVAGHGSSFLSGDFNMYHASTEAGLWVRANVPLKFGTNNTSRMEIAAGGAISTSGNLGIGGAPSYPLDVYTSDGRIQFRGDIGSNQNNIVSANTANNAYYDLSINAAALIFNGTSLTANMQSVLNELVTINRAETPLQLNNSGGGSQMFFMYQGASKRGSVGADSSNLLYLFNSSDVTRLELTQGGALKLNAYGAGTLVTDSSGNVTASSDEVLKYVVGNFTRGLTDLRAMDAPVRYQWRGEQMELAEATDAISGTEAKLAAAQTSLTAAAIAAEKEDATDADKDSLRETEQAVTRLAGALADQRYRAALSREGTTYTGWTAQGVQKGIPEAVKTGPDGLLNLDERPLLAAMYNALLEMAARVEALEAAQ